MQALKFADRSTELLTLLYIVHRQFVGALSDAQRHHARADALRIIGRHQAGETAFQAFWGFDQTIGIEHQILHDDFSFRYAAQTHGRFTVPDTQALFAGQRDKTANAEFFALFIEHPGEDQMKPGCSAACDPVFFPIEYVLIAFSIGARGHLTSGTAGARLSDTNGGFIAREHVLGREFFLCFIAVFHDGGNGAHIAFHHDSTRDSTGFGHFLDHQHRVMKRQPQSAILFGHGHAHKARFGQVLDIIPGIFLVNIMLFGARADDGLRQMPGIFLNFKLFVTELVHRFI